MPWHKKKERKDDAWKISRGIHKDEKKCCNGRHKTFGYDKWTKFFDKRKRRRFEKKAISSGRWDRLEAGPSCRRHEDRWNWD